MPAVFVSHTTADHRDYELAHRLAEALGQCGARTWIAPDSMPELQNVPYCAGFSEQLAAVLDAVGLEPRGLEARKLPLTVPEASPAPATALDSGWLVYQSRVSALIGRDDELEQLSAFYGDARPFLWWAIEGPGGVGKSRLALESLGALNADWYAGFLRPSDLADFDWHNWIPDQKVSTEDLEEQLEESETRPRKPRRSWPSCGNAAPNTSPVRPKRPADR